MTEIHTVLKRDIAFRAWNTYQAKMEYFVDYLPDLNEGDHDGNWEVMQYIGIKDSNGKEIYEGDIVRLTNNKYWSQSGQDAYHMQGVGVVRYEFPEFRAYKKNDSLGLSLSWGGTDVIEVIGNIYQDSELL